MTIRTPSSKGRTRRVASILTGVVALALAATVSGPVPSASALARSNPLGTPGEVYFADAHENATPVLKATRVRQKVELSVGGISVTPVRSAPAGAQTVDVTYLLFQRNLDGVYVLDTWVQSPRQSLWSEGSNRPQSFPGIGTISTVTRSGWRSFKIAAIVTWYVDGRWQSSVTVAPDQPGEFVCAHLAYCEVVEHSGGLALDLE